MDNPEKLATQDEDKQNKKHNKLCVGHHYLQASTNNINKTRVLQTTGGKDEPRIVLCGNRNGHHNTELRT